MSQFRFHMCWAWQSCGNSNLGREWKNRFWGNNILYNWRCLRWNLDLWIGLKAKCKSRSSGTTFKKNPWSHSEITQDPGNKMYLVHPLDLHCSPSCQWYPFGWFLKFSCPSTYVYVHLEVSTVPCVQIRFFTSMALVKNIHLETIQKTTNSLCSILPLSPF